MSTIAILTETTADLTERQKLLPDLYQIPLYILFGNESYKENIDISHQEYYQKMEEIDYLPTTSQPTPADFMAKYEEILKQGYDEIIVITMSSKLSGTNQSAVLAAEDFENVHVFNTRMASFGEGLIVEQACRLVEEGASSGEILDHLKILDEETKLLAMLVTLDNIVKGGRLPKAAASIQSFLGLKFIIRLGEGKVSLVRQTRTESKGFQAMAKEFEKARAESDQPLKAVIAHVNSPESGRELLDYMNEQFPEVDFEITSIGPVIGTHAGNSAVGLGWLPDYLTEK